MLFQELATDTLVGDAARSIIPNLEAETKSIENWERERAQKESLANQRFEYWSNILSEVMFKNFPVKHISYDSIESHLEKSTGLWYTIKYKFFLDAQGLYQD